MLTLRFQYCPNPKTVTSMQILRSVRTPDLHPFFKTNIFQKYSNGSQRLFSRQVSFNLSQGDILFFFRSHVCNWGVSSESLQIWHKADPWGLWSYLFHNNRCQARQRIHSQNAVVTGREWGRRSTNLFLAKKVYMKCSGLFFHRAHTVDFRFELSSQCHSESLWV